MSSTPFSPMRRHLLATSVAAGVSAMLPTALHAATGATGIRPFAAHIPDDAVADLRRRIAATRWPGRETVADESQGVRLARMQALLRYWGTDYDWRKGEARLNGFPMFITEIDGPTFISFTCALGTSAMPMIMTHGWPADLRVAEGDRPADRSDRARRERGRCVSRRRAVVAGFRLLGPSDTDRLGFRPHRARMGRADGAARLYALRVAGRRLRLGDLAPDGDAARAGPRRDPREHAGDGAAGYRDAARDRCARAGFAVAEGEGRVRSSRRSIATTAATRR